MGTEGPGELGDFEILQTRTHISQSHFQRGLHGWNLNSESASQVKGQGKGGEGIKRDKSDLVFVVSSFLCAGGLSSRKPY